VPRDAEQWLAQRGVVREPLVPAATPSIGPVAAPIPASVSEPLPGPGPDAGSALTPSDRGDIAEAVAFIRRSTTNAPQSEGRLQEKLTERGFESAVIEAALAQARTERLVDDDALLAALIVERRGRGHADRRLRQDLRSRGFTGEQVDLALRLLGPGDPDAAAFALAREQAIRQQGVDAEAAVRRIVGFLLRRGHPEGLAHKAARDAVYAERDARRSAER